MKKIIYALFALTVFAFVSCSKDDDVDKQQSSGGPLSQRRTIGGVLNQVDMSNMTFSDSATIVNFESVGRGRAAITIDADTTTIKVDVPFVYIAEKIVAGGGDYNYHIYDFNDNSSTKIKVSLTIDKDDMEVTPVSARMLADGILPDFMTAEYDKITNKMRFSLVIPEGKTILYTLTKRL